MRPALFAMLAVSLAACESDLRVVPSTVEWMEWPAEVPVAMPFSVRLLVSRPGCFQGVYKPGVTADESAVTFAPYFLVKNTTPILCLREAQPVDIYYADLDTVGTAPGLPADFARTFEMRAAASVYAPTAPLAAADLPVRTYGEVTVRCCRLAQLLRARVTCSKTRPTRPSATDSCAATSMMLQPRYAASHEFSSFCRETKVGCRAAPARLGSASDWGDSGRSYLRSL